MRVTTGLADAGWHGLEQSGAYEWWYLDALSDDGETAVVAIFFAGLPFSPSYLSAHERGLEPKALDHVAVFAGVYVSGRPVAYALDTYPAGTFARSAAAGELARVGGNRIERDTRDPSVLAIHLDLPVLVDNPPMFARGRMRGSIRFVQATPAPDLSGLPAGHDDGHVWNLVAPRGRVACTLDVEPARGEARRVEFAGSGYHDHNYGTRPLTEGLARWHWGRAHIGSATAIFYGVEPAAGAPESFLALLGGESGDLATRAATLTAAGWRRRPLCPRYPTSVVVEAESVRVSASPRHVVDWGPFYMRFVSDFRVETTGGRTLAGRGISEYLDPRGLRNRLYRPLIRTRIRPGEPSST